MLVGIVIIVVAIPSFKGVHSTPPEAFTAVAVGANMAKLGLVILAIRGGVALSRRLQHSPGMLKVGTVLVVLGLAALWAAWTTAVATEPGGHSMPPWLYLTSAVCLLVKVVGATLLVLGAAEWIGGKLKQKST